MKGQRYQLDLGDGCYGPGDFPLTTVQGAGFVRGPHLLHLMRRATASSVAVGPHRRASASGSAIRCAPHLHVIRNRKWPRASTSFLMCGNTPMPEACSDCQRHVHPVCSERHCCMRDLSSGRGCTSHTLARSP